MAGVKGKSGGYRPGAGRKPTEKTLFMRNFVGPLLQKKPRAEFNKKVFCQHEKPRFANGKERKFCFVCQPKKSTGRPRKECALRSPEKRFCECCLSEFNAATYHNKYCSDKCRNSANNRVAETSGRASSHRKRWYKERPEYAMKVRIRGLIHKAITRLGSAKSKRTEEILGCSIEEFARHIERQFAPSMSWDNRGEWHIDHIIPLASATSVEEVERLNHFTNLRPLWASDNLSKKDKIEFLL